MSFLGRILKVIFWLNFESEFLRSNFESGIFWLDFEIELFWLDFESDFFGLDFKNLHRLIRFMWL